MAHSEMHEITKSLLGYIDPGAGSMLIQAIVAGVLTLGYTVRGKIGVIKAAAGKILNRR